MKYARDPGGLRRLLAKRAISARGLSRMARCSAPTILRLLDGKRISAEHARSVARVLGIGFNELFTDEAAEAATSGSASATPAAVA